MKVCHTLCLLTLLLLSCKRGGETATSHEPPAGDSPATMAQAEESIDTIVIRYAKGLRVSYESDGVHVLITDPSPAGGHAASEEFVVSKPAERFVCTTALQLGNFEALGLESRVVGINSIRSLFSPVIKEQMKSGQTVTIGREGVFDIEAVMASKPDYILVSASKHGGFEALRQCGVTLIPHHGYKETDPLGQAEWVKLIGLLTGETRRANAIFAGIEREYLQLKEEVARQTAGKRKPTVASGRQVREGWYAVGGRSYMANIFRDAGAVYVMQGNDASGGITMDFEAAYAKSAEAQFWQIDGKHSGDYTLRTLADEDPRYTTMQAYKTGKVLFCNFAQTPYRELAPVQPHLVLADFVKAFHPEVLPHYTPTFYKFIH